MDYVLSEAMLFLAGLTFLLVFYDIWCFYSVHLLTRMEKSPGISIPEGLVVSGGIDQFHVHGHKRECYPRYSPHFVPGAGVQTGDIIETLWAPLNKISDSTRGMSAAHRQEFNDDFMNDSNWNKLTRLSKHAPPTRKMFRLTVCKPHLS